MCDYCDCRSHAEVALLSADHEVLLGLVRDLACAVYEVDRERARALVGRLDERLARHSVREERGVFAQLRDAVVDDGYVDRFERDHDQLHALLGRMDGDEWQRTAPDLIAVLSEHIAREESDLFPAAHQLLAPSQWDAVASAVATVAS